MLQTIDTATSQITTDVRRVTPSLASNWLINCQFDGQRRLRTGHVTFLATVMAAGHFKAGSLEFAEYDGKWFLIDGQHRLNAIVRCGMSFDMPIIVHHCVSMEEVESLYSREDRGLGRSLVDALSPHNLSEELGLPNKMVWRVGNCTAFLASGFALSPGSGGRHHLAKAGDLRLAVVRDWAKEARAFHDAVAGGNAQIVLYCSASPVLSVALVTFRFRPERAEHFWRDITLNDGLRHRSPEHTLHNFITQNRIQKRGDLAYSRAVACAWNAFYEGRPLTAVRYPDPRAPIVIRGTPYDGRRLVVPSYAKAYGQGDAED